jgi:hypothetical protein
MTDNPYKAPWTIDHGQLRNSDGEVLASIPYSLGDEHDQAVARLLCAAPELLEAAKFTLDVLENMTTEQFQRGEDKPAREALSHANSLVEGKDDSHEE